MALKDDVQVDQFLVRFLNSFNFKCTMFSI